MKIGDVVELKSGSPRMTVIGEYHGGDCPAGYFKAVFFEYSHAKFSELIAHEDAFVVAKSEAAE